MIFDLGNGVDKIGLKKMEFLISIFKLELRYIVCRVFKLVLLQLQRVIRKVGKLGEIKLNFIEILLFFFIFLKLFVI